MTLVQQIPDDNLWTPSGQPGLADDIYKANEEAKKPRDDPTDIGDLFVQLPTKQQWNAHGQSDMQKSAKKAAEQEEKDDIEKSSDDYTEAKTPQEPAEESIFG